MSTARVGLLGIVVAGVMALVVSVSPGLAENAQKEPAKSGKADGNGDHPEKEESGDEAHEEHGGPAIFPPALELGIWTLVVFILLLFVLGKWAWGPILAGLHKREENIRLAAEEAKTARAETEKVRNEFKAEMDKAYAEIPKMMEEARKDAANLREEMKTKAAAEIQQDRERLRRDIETAKDQALKEIWDQSAQLATLISAKAIGKSLSESDHQRLTEEALAEVREAGDQWKSELRQFGEEWSRQGGSNS